ncbi:MAG TPA: acetate--CoA ligase family protein, partial [Vicinamibacterales bacterium]
LPERESLARLAAAGVPVTPARAVPADDGGDGAVAAWRELGARGVVLKLDAVGLAHKTEAGGVRLGLSDEAAIRAAASELRDVAAAAGIEMRGLLVEPMAVPGVELIVGGRRDAVFGPAVLVGVGGILAEVLDDVVVLLAPVTTAEVRERLGTLRAAPILHGVRGRPGVDLDALAAFVVAIGDLLVADPSVVEIDCNPVIAGPEGAVAVDALVVKDFDGSPSRA